MWKSWTRLSHPASSNINTIVHPLGKASKLLSKVAVEDSVAVDDKVWMRVICRGTHLGQFKGLPPTGKRFEITEVHIARIENGKAVEHWGVADTVGLMQQLGVTK